MAAAGVLAGALVVVQQGLSRRDDATPATTAASAATAGASSKPITFSRGLPQNGSHRRRTLDADVTVTLKLGKAGIQSTHAVSKTVLEEDVDEVSNGVIHLMKAEIVDDQVTDQSTPPSETRKLYKGRRYTIVGVSASDGKPEVYRGFDDLSAKPMPFAGSHRGGDMATWIEREFVDNFYLWIADPDLTAIPVPERPLTQGEVVPELAEPLRSALQRYLLDPLYGEQRGDSPPSDRLTRASVRLRDADALTGTFCFEFTLVEKSAQSLHDRGTQEFSGCARIRRADSWLEDLDANGRSGDKDTSTQSWSKIEQHLHTSIRF